MCGHEAWRYPCWLHVAAWPPGYEGNKTLLLVCFSAGCSPSLSPEAKSVYVLFFLLSSLILTLLLVAGLLYHRHRRGTFLVRCRSSSSISPPDLNNNHHHHDDDYAYPVESEQPPPLPPARGPRGGWPQGKEPCPAVDLPLLRFSSLLSPDSYVEPQEGGKM